MPILRPQAPSSATAALFGGFSAFLTNSDQKTAAIISSQKFIGAQTRIPTPEALGFQGGAVPNQIPDYSPIRVSTLSVGAVLRGEGISAASVPSGWRYFVSQNPTSIPVALAHVSQRSLGGAWKVAASFFGPGVADLRSAATDLAPFQASAITYELAYLTVPSLNVEAFHLKATDESGDFLVPFPKRTAQLMRGLDCQDFYTEAEFLTVLRALVQRAQSSIPHAGG
jgi:hypothetical protein